MADAATDDRTDDKPATDPAPTVASATPGPDFNTLWGDIDKASKGLADIKRREAGENERIIRGNEALVAKDRSIARAHYDAAGIEAQRLQPWDSQRQWEDVSTKPFEAFGSFASAFAIVASAFTRAPMENALNASAAAMNAIHKGDQEAYERAFAGYKNNMDLAQKRFTMQNTLYNDALNLMQHDMAAGREAMKNAAIRFGDQKAIFLLDHGMDKEMIDLTTSRIKQFDAFTEASQNMTRATFRDQALRIAMEENSKITDPGTRAAHNLTAFNRIYGVKEGTPQQEILRQYLLEKPNATAEEIAAFATKNGLFYRAGTAGTGGVVTDARLQARQIDELAKKLQLPKEQGGKGLDSFQAYTEARQTVMRAAAVPTANVLERQKEHAEGIKSVTNMIDRAIQLAESTEVNPTGMKGALYRLGEWAGFVDGGDAHEFEQLARTIQQELPNALPMQAKSRLNIKDRGDYDVIVPGLGRFTNRDSAINGLKRLKEIINKQDIVQSGLDAPPILVTTVEEAKAALAAGRKYITPDGQEFEP